MEFFLNDRLIKTIVFDIGGVLIDIHPEKTFQYISNCIDTNIATLRADFPNKIHDEYERGHLNNEEWFTKYKESLPQPCFLKEIDFWKAWSLLLGREKRTVETLKNLSKHYSIWLLSNTNPKHIKNELEKNYSFSNLVDGAIYSFETGFRKPEIEIYEYFVNKSNSEPNACLFIDDLYENVKGAKNFGMHSIQFFSRENLLRDLKKMKIKGL